MSRLSFYLLIGTCVGSDMVRGACVSCVFICGLECVLVVICLEMFVKCLLYY